MREMSELKKLEERAQKAKDKPAPFGPDIDLNKYSLPPLREAIPSLGELSEEIKEISTEVGIDIEERERSGSYFQLDRAPIYEKVKNLFHDRLEIMSTEEAIRKYNWLSDYWWQAVQVDTDKYTAAAQLYQTHGYFIRSLPNQKITFPVQACLFIGENEVTQNVHNLVIAEEGSELNVLTGCTINPKVKEGLHIGISEFYVKKNATLTFTMIHNWGEDFHVRPRSVAILEEGATFISNYIILRPVRSLQLYPTAILKGKDARATFNSIIYGQGTSLIDAGSRIIFAASQTRGESVTRSIAADRSVLYMRGELIGQAEESKGHLDCRGILLSPQAKIEAIPILQAEEPQSDLSHEAAIGPVAQEAVEYLMTRGLKKEEAISAITRGFLTLQMPGLSGRLEKEVDRALQLTSAEAL